MRTWESARYTRTPLLAALALALFFTACSDAGGPQPGEPSGPELSANTSCSTDPPPKFPGEQALFDDDLISDFIADQICGNMSPANAQSALVKWVAIIRARGDITGKVFDLFDFVSKKHDLAYDAAQQKLLGDLSNPNKSAQQAFHDYYSTLAKVDREFLDEMAAGHSDMSLSGDPWETEALRRAKHAFTATELTNQALANQFKRAKSDIGDRYRTQIGDRNSALIDVHQKLERLSRIVEDDVVGGRVKTVMDQLRNRIAELDGRPPVRSYGEAFAYVNDPEEAEAAYARKKDAR